MVQLHRRFSKNRRASKAFFGFMVLAIFIRCFFKQILNDIHLDEAIVVGWGLLCIRVSLLDEEFDDFGLKVTLDDELSLFGQSAYIELVLRGF